MRKLMTVAIATTGLLLAVDLFRRKPVFFLCFLLLSLWHGGEVGIGRIGLMAAAELLDGFGE